VSSRSVQFSIKHSPFKKVTISSFRAYTMFTPSNTLASNIKHVGDDSSAKVKQAANVRFVSLQQIHWDINELIEYCAPLSPGTTVPLAYDPATSKPTRQYSLKFMEWKPITMQRELLDSGTTVEKMLLVRQDGKIRISCVIPVRNARSVYGEEVSLTTEKCTFYVNRFHFDLKCPAGKKGSLALVTKVTSRDDTDNGTPQLTPKFEGQMTFNKNKVSMQFEQEAVIHTVTTNSLGKTEIATRNSVPVIMTTGKNLEWISDPRFRNSRRVFFSFIVSDVHQIKTGFLKWDPEIMAHFKHAPKVLDQNLLANSVQGNNAHKQSEPTPDPEVKLSRLPSLMIQVGKTKSSAARLSASLLSGAAAFLLVMLQHAGVF